MVTTQRKAKNPSATVRVFEGQPGPQERFLASKANIVVAGGSKGGGKSYGLCLQFLRYHEHSGYGGVIFRREYNEITAQGGLWDTSMQIFPHFGGVPRESDHEWRFPSGVRLKFSHMEHENDRIKWEGSQIPFIGIDQAEQFTDKQFWSLVGCNRSVCGVRPRMYLNCNPDPDCFLRKLMAWWIDPETGYAIAERSGVVRWFIRVSDEEVWADTPEELKRDHGDDVRPISFTFVPSSHHDNPALTTADPDYEAKLAALPLVERERKLGRKGIGGNWNIRETAGTIFRREWFKIIPAVPQCERWVRYWDRAATDAASAKKKSSWTVGLLLGRTTSTPPQWVIADLCRGRWSPHDVDAAIKNTASQDGYDVEVVLEQDPGQAGKKEAEYLVGMLAGYVARTNPVREMKAVRARPVSSQAQVGNILVVEAPWTDGLLERLENFDGTDKCISDDADALSGAFSELEMNQLQEAGTW